MQYLVTYQDHRSANGEGVSIIDADDIVEFGKRHFITTCYEYIREADPILTPSVIAACSGTSPSI